MLGTLSSGYPLSALESRWAVCEGCGGAGAFVMVAVQKSDRTTQSRSSPVGFIYVVPSVGADYLQPSLQQVPTWFENTIYFGPCKIPMRPRMQPGDYIFGVSPANGSPRRVIFTGRIETQLSYAEAFDQLPKLRGPQGPIHVRPTRSPGLGFPDSHYEHIPGANHADSWRNDLRTPDLDVFFACQPANGPLGRWLGAAGPTLNNEILQFLRTCDVYGAGGRRLGKNAFATGSAPVAHGRLYRGLHLETEDPERFLSLVSQSVKVADAAQQLLDAGALAPTASTRQRRSCSGSDAKSTRKSKILFARIGADQTSGGGGWNGPIDTTTNAFVYVPIPETKALRTGLGTAYSTISPALAEFGLTLPAHLMERYMHLDPDFEFSTYGDRGPKGAQLCLSLREGDLLMFYAGLRSTNGGGLVYALIGMLSVKRVVKAAEREPGLWHTNAHTRRHLPANADDVVVVGDPKRSGRLARAIPIGEFRAGAYRVAESLLTAWGGISARDGFLQRSAVFPSASDPIRFLRWWDEQGVKLVRENNPVAAALAGEPER